MWKKLLWKELDSKDTNPRLNALAINFPQTIRINSFLWPKLQDFPNVNRGNNNSAKGSNNSDAKGRNNNAKRNTTTKKEKNILETWK